jgi:Asparaginase, N-terminal
MRPATAISADRLYKLLEAVTVAASPASRHRGAVVVLIDRIASAYYVVKLNANTLDAFKALEMGYLGEVISDKPIYFYPPVTPTGKTAIDISKITSIPRVDILYSYQDMHNDTLYNAIQSGAKGIVVRLPKPHLILERWADPGPIRSPVPERAASRHHSITPSKTYSTITGFPSSRACGQIAAKRLLTMFPIKTPCILPADISTQRSLGSFLACFSLREERHRDCCHVCRLD